MVSNFNIPDGKKVRVIINSDVKNEVDDQFAIIHALLSESFDLRGIIAAHFGNDMKYVYGTTKRKIRVYTNINPRFILEDFYCKLKSEYADGSGGK